MPRLPARSSPASWPLLLVGLSLLGSTARAAEPSDVLLAESLDQGGKQLFDVGTTVGRARLVVRPVKAATGASKD